MDKGAWWAIVHGDQKQSDMTDQQTRLFISSQIAVNIVSNPHFERSFFPYQFTLQLQGKLMSGEAPHGPGRPGPPQPLSCSAPDALSHEQILEP